MTGRTPLSVNRRSFLTSYTSDRIRNTLPIVPFTFRNQRVQRFADFLLTEFGDELFKLVLNFISNRWLELWRKSFRYPADAYLFCPILFFEPVIARRPRDSLRKFGVSHVIQVNASEPDHGCSTCHRSETEIRIQSMRRTSRRTLIEPDKRRQTPCAPEAKKTGENRSKRRTGVSDRSTTQSKK